MTKPELDLSHLHPKVRHLVNSDNKERVNAVLTQKWLGYERAKQTIDRLEALLNHPRQHRMPGILIYGRTNNGKTMIIERFLRDHPPNDNPEGDAANIPVLNIQMPISPDPRRVYTAILSEAFASFNSAKHVSELEKHALHQMKACGVRMLIMDEFHNMLQGTDKQQKAFLNLLRFIGNDMKIPIACFGIQKSPPALHYDEQLATRYEPWPLHDWGYDKETAKLLNGIESLLPLKKKSRLSNKETARYILVKGDRTIGGMLDLIKLAAIKAIETGYEQIDIPLMDNCGYISPSDRRASAVEIAKKIRKRK